MGENGHDREEIPWESLGAFCVGNLASKIIFSIFPPGTSPVKLSPDRKTKMELMQIQETEDQAALRYSIETGLARVEREFVEAFDFEKVPLEKRPYHNLQQLLEKSTGFWNNYVRPMLDFEAGGVHRYLTTAGQPNPYLQAVEANLAELQRRLQTGTG